MDEENVMGVSDEKGDRDSQGRNGFKKGSGVDMMLLSTGRQQALQKLSFSPDLKFAQVSASQMKAGN